MGVEVYLEDENGNRLADFGEYNDWDYISSEDEIAHSICLRFIDPYGDTTFNKLQLPILLHELRELLPKSKTDQARAVMELLVQNIEAAAQKYHTYVKFYGD